MMLNKVAQLLLLFYFTVQLENYNATIYGVTLYLKGCA